MDKSATGVAAEDVRPSESPKTDPRQKPLTPFLKWAGGKRWLARRCSEWFDVEYDRYIEPFLGSASMFFALRPKDSILADCNGRLIEAYIEVRRNPSAIEASLSRYQELHDDKYYYMERARQYPDSATARAAQFIYLNRTCWNGLYRVNRRGEFNVPRGTKETVVLETDDFATIAAALDRATLVAQDFEETICEAGPGDLVYVDPPYTVKHNHNAFRKYNEKIFSWEDQVRLKQAVVAAIRRGARVAVSNADHQSVKELYRGVGRHTSISRKSVISGCAEHRGAIKELLVLSW